MKKHLLALTLVAGLLMSASSFAEEFIGKSVALFVEGKELMAIYTPKDVCDKHIQKREVCFNVFHKRDKKDNRSERSFSMIWSSKGSELREKTYLLHPLYRMVGSPLQNDTPIVLDIDGVPFLQLQIVKDFATNVVSGFLAPDEILKLQPADLDEVQDEIKKLLKKN